MSFWHSVVLGIVEGVTEFLPISSTGHLILATQLLRLPQDGFIKSFEIIIQLGAISSVIFLYWKTLWNMETLKKLVVAFIPTGIIGILLYKVVKTYLLGNSTVVLWSLLIGGIALILFEKTHALPPAKAGLPEVEAQLGIKDISYSQAASVGLFQTLALIPGVSRSAATILGGSWLGLKRATIVEFSFLLAVPTMLAASGLDLLQNYASFEAEQIGALVTGFIVSFIVATFSIKFLLRYIQKNDFTRFGIYRIVIALVLWLVLKLPS